MFPKTFCDVQQIRVIAADYGMPSLSAEVIITISVIDENDNPPIITSQKNMTLTSSYETPVNLSMGQVIAYDSDSGDNGKLAYFIQSGKNLANNMVYLLSVTIVKISIVEYMT